MFKKKLVVIILSMLMSLPTMALGLSHTKSSIVSYSYNAKTHLPKRLVQDSIYLSYIRRIDGQVKVQQQNWNTSSGFDRISYTISSNLGLTLTSIDR